MGGFQKLGVSGQGADAGGEGAGLAGAEQLAGAADFHVLLGNLEDILLADDVVTSILDYLDYIVSIIPEIQFMFGFLQKHPHHHLNVWDHTLYALSFSEKDFMIRLALLLHDSGKPFSFQEGEVRHFKNHPKVSMEITNYVLRQLSFDDDFIRDVCFIVLNHDTPIKSSLIENNYDLALKIYKVQYCDCMAHHPEHLENRIKYLSKTREMFLRYQ